jgi:carboxyl-terminal processing protease
MLLTSFKTIALLTLSIICTSSFSQTPPKKPIPVEALRTLSTTYSVLQQQFVTAVDGDQLITSAIRGLLREIDPDGGEYFTEEELNAFKQGSQPGIGKIGAELKARDGEYVFAPMPGGQAMLAGLRIGDSLQAVDDRKIKGLSIYQAIRLTEGPIGTKVKLTVIRERAVAAIDVVIERKLVEFPSVTLSRVTQDIALLRVPASRQGTMKEIVDKLVQEWQLRPLHGLILDLRGNQGGLLTASIEMASLFLEPDVVVAKTVGNAPSSNEEYRANKISTSILPYFFKEFKSIPLVVLIDRGTAAGAEIIAAALKDHQRATLIGQQTFGRGSIQTITPLPGSGAIKFTSAYWKSPSGTDIHGTGVQPHQVVAEEDPQRAIQAAVEKLGSRLLNDTQKTK